MKNTILLISTAVVIAVAGLTYFYNNDQMTQKTIAPEPARTAETVSDNGKREENSVKQTAPVSSQEESSSDVEIEIPEVNMHGILVPDMPKTAHDFLIGRTFWNKNNQHMRIYFKSREEAILQPLRNLKNFKVGEIYNVEWFYEGRDILCLSEKKNKENTLCFKIDTRFVIHGSAGRSDRIDFLIGENEVAFSLNRQEPGNAIIKDGKLFEVVAHQRALKEVETNIQQGLIDFQAKPYNELDVDANIKSYLDKMLNHLWIGPSAYYYLMPDGTYTTIFNGDLHKNRDDLNAMRMAVKKGVWSVLDKNKFCMKLDGTTKPYFVTCMRVTNPEEVFEEPKQVGFVVHTHSGFMVYHEPNKLIPYDDFEYIEVLR